MSQSETSYMFDSLAVVARDGAGRVKDARFLQPFAGKVWQFVPNRLYLNLVNKGRIKPNQWKVPVILGRWSVVNA